MSAFRIASVFHRVFEQPRRLAPLAFTCALASCAKKSPPEAEELVQTRARAALEPFKKSLKEELGKALAESAEKAIDVCALRAPALAREHSKEGVVVGRSALRLRNPENRAPSWLAPAMKELSLSEAESASKVVALPEGRHAYVESIRIAPLCLGCHGDAVAPALLAKIATRYPSDEATGYKLGEFRGVFWAELTPSSAR